MKKILFITLGIVLLVSLSLVYVNAEQLGKPININVQCVNSTYANITSIIYTTNSTYLIQNETAMTKAGTNYNYSLNNSLNTATGQLQVNYHCDVNGIDTVAGYSITVTNTGYSLTNADVIIIFIIFLTLESVSIFLFYLGMNINNQPVKIFLLIFSGILTVFSVGYSLTTGLQFLGEFASQITVINAVYILSIALMTAGGVGLIAYLIYYAVVSFYKMRGLKE